MAFWWRVAIFTGRCSYILVSWLKPIATFSQQYQQHSEISQFSYTELSPFNRSIRMVFHLHIQVSEHHGFQGLYYGLMFLLSCHHCHQHSFLVSAAKIKCHQGCLHITLFFYSCKCQGESRMFGTSLKPEIMLKLKENNSFKN